MALYAQGGQRLEVDVANSTCSSAYATVASSAAVKKLYLSDPNQALDRVDPVFTSDTTTANTALLGSSSGHTAYRLRLTIPRLAVGPRTRSISPF